MKNIIEAIASNKAVLTGEPVYITDIYDCNADFVLDDFPEIPEQVMYFYSEINGFNYNGIEIFSMDSESTIDFGTNYKIKDIVIFNRQLYSGRKWPFEKKYIFLGRFDEDYIAYNPIDEKYQVLAREDFMVYEEYEDFISLLETVMTLRGIR